MFFVKLEWEEDNRSNIGQILKNNKRSIPATSPIQINSDPIYLKRLPKQNSTDIVVYIPITEDFTWEMKSSFKNSADAMGDIPILSNVMDLFQKLNRIGGSLGGKIGAGNESMKFQVWDNTEPFTMNLKLKLYTKTNPYWDVYFPAISLVSQNILSMVKTGKNSYSLYTPGINSRMSGFVKKSRTDESNPRESATQNSGGAEKTTDDEKKKQIEKFSQAPGNKILNRVSIVSRYQKLSNAASAPLSQTSERTILLIKTAILETSKPTWSMHSTESGYPVWAELDLNIQSSFSAADDMFVWTRPDKTGLGVGRGIGAAAIEVSNNVFR